MVFRLLWIGLVVCLLWAGWWLAATTGLQRGLDRVVAARPESGWRLSASRVSTSGFPFRLSATLGQPTLTNPDIGTNVVASRLDLSAPAWWPGYMKITLPETPIAMTHAMGVATLNAAEATADLRLRPGIVLDLDSAFVRSGPWRLAQGGSDILAAETLQMSVKDNDAAGATYDIAIDAQELAPADAVRDALALPSDWPQTFDDTTADLSVTLDRPLDRHALNGPTPQPRAIDLRRVAVTWGAMQLTASGQLTIDDQGVPAGNVTVTARDWRRMLDIATAAGLVPANMRQQAELMLRAVAGMSGQTDSLDLDLRFADGNMALGAINLGAAPRVILR